MGMAPGSITKTVDEGFSSYYIFTNGACGDYSCKEQLAGLPCSNPDNYNDRYVGNVYGRHLIQFLLQ